MDYAILSKNLAVISYLTRKFGHAVVDAQRALTFCPTIYAAPRMSGD